MSRENLECIKFTAHWCTPCAAIQPTFLELKERFPWVVCSVVDVGRGQDDLVLRYNVTSVPTFVFLRDGQEIHRITQASKSLLSAGFEACFSASLPAAHSEEESETDDTDSSTTP